MKNDQSLINAAGLAGLPEELIHAGTVDLFSELSAYLDELITADFHKLVSILYRMDVSEKKVRTALANAPDGISAGEIIARLMVAREQEKMEWRKKYREGKL